jgi:hypothetical protein
MYVRTAMSVRYCRVRCMVPCRRAVPVRVVTPASRRRVFRVRGGNRRCVSTRTACGHGNSHGAWPHAPPGMPAPNGSNRVLTFTNARPGRLRGRSVPAPRSTTATWLRLVARVARARAARRYRRSRVARHGRAGVHDRRTARTVARPRRGPAGRRTHGGHGAALAARMILHGVWRGKHDERSICPANPANPEPARAAAHQSSPVPGLRSGARSRTSRAKG